MDLHSTLQEYVLQLKNTPRTLLSVVGVVQQLMKVLYDTHFPNAEAHSPVGIPILPILIFSRLLGDRKHVFSSDAAKQSEATISGGFSQTAGGVAASD